MEMSSVCGMTPIIKFPRGIFWDHPTPLVLRGVYGVIATLGYYGGVGYLTAMRACDLHPDDFATVVSSLKEGGIVRVTDNRLSASPRIGEESGCWFLKDVPIEMCKDTSLSIEAKGFFFTCLWAMGISRACTKLKISKRIGKDEIKHLDALIDKGVLFMIGDKVSVDARKTGIRGYGVPFRLDEDFAYESFMKALSEAPYERIFFRCDVARRIVYYIYDMTWHYAEDLPPRRFWMRCYRETGKVRETSSFSFLPRHKDPFTFADRDIWSYKPNTFYPELEGTELLQKIVAFLESVGEALATVEADRVAKGLDKQEVAIYNIKSYKKMRGWKN